jgi:hypothetical protein
MFQQYVEDLKAIKESLAAGEFSKAWGQSIALQQKLRDLYDMLVGNNPPEFGADGGDTKEFDKELAAVEAEANAVRANPTVGANPLAILAAIKAGIELAKMLRDLWRSRQQDGGSNPQG